MRTLLLIPLLLCAACSAGVDTNSTTTLVKKDPLNANAPTSLVEADIKANVNRDVISFGAAECENLVAVREAGAPLTGNDAAPVTGFCSRSCTPGVAHICDSEDPSLDKNPATAMSCRKLLLDGNSALPPELAGTSPFFCARAPHTSP